MTAVELIDEGVWFVTRFGIGLLVMTIVGSVLFYQARGAMKPGDAWLFAIFATAMMALPLLVGGSWTWAVAGAGMAALLVWLWRAKKEG